MRIALAQINTVVGDIPGNAARTLDALDSGARQGADLVVFPELTLTGYPPEDLLLREGFVRENAEALARVASACEGIAAIVGFVDRGGGASYNAAALCYDGRVQAVYRKRHLLADGVLCETLYYEPGDEIAVVPFGGLRIAMTICEDVWMPDVVAQAASAGADLVVNLSACPLHAGRCAEREAVLRSRAADSGVWLAYCNLVGGQDELVFDGRSIVLSPAGKVVARAAAFTEDLLLADIALESGGGKYRIEPAVSGTEEVYRALVLGLGDYVRKNGFTDVVLGLSGGVDSALVAAIATDALEAAHVHGVMMPSRYSSAGSIEDALVLAANLGIEVMELPIEPAFSAMLGTLEPVFEGREFDVTEENLQARVRGTLLMALSNKFGWLVLSTGNKSEALVGYATLYGDMVGGIAPLKDVFKTHIWELARWRNRDGEVIPASTIAKPPSAELREGQTDQDTLPPYDELDAILAGYLVDELSPHEIVARGHDEATVKRVCRMVDLAEFKRRQGPLGIRVTTRASARDRRMPVTNRYRG